MPRGEAEYCASNSQIFLPVDASKATTRLYGVARYITSPTTSGVVLDWRTRGAAGVPRPDAPSGGASGAPRPGAASGATAPPRRPRPGGSTTGASASNDQASCNFVTFFALICLSGEYRVPPASWPIIG